MAYTPVEKVSETGASVRPKFGDAVAEKAAVTSKSPITDWKTGFEPGGVLDLRRRAIFDSSPELISRLIVAGGVFSVCEGNSQGA